MSRRVTAALAIVSYLLAIVVVPELHRLHHLAHGDDHEHTAVGTIYASTPSAADLDEATHHATFDAVLVDLGLAEVATAGTLTVDCDYTDLTLATCDAAATSAHPRTFGDDLLARTHHSDPPVDPHHGQGSLEHLASSLLASPTTFFPPPHLPVERISVALQDDSIPIRFRATYAARGPPRAS